MHVINVCVQVKKKMYVLCCVYSTKKKWLCPCDTRVSIFCKSL